MKPFKQTETGKTKTAMVIAVNVGESPMYSTAIQQTPVREKLNGAINNLNGFSGGFL